MTKTTTWRRWRRSARGLTCADCYRKWKRQRQRLTTFPYLNYSIWICFHLAGYWRARAEVEIYVSSCDFYGSTSVDDLLQPGSTFSVARSHLGLSGYNWILFSPAALLVHLRFAWRAGEIERICTYYELTKNLRLSRCSHVALVIVDSGCRCGWLISVTFFMQKGFRRRQTSVAIRRW